MRTTILFILTFISLHSTLFAQDPIGPKSGIKAGFDISDLFSSKSHSYKKDPEEIIGLYSAIPVSRMSEGAIFLGVELNYVKLTYFRTNQHFFVTDYEALYQIAIDEKFDYGFVELCLPLEYLTSVTRDAAVGFYIGPSIGFGHEDLETKGTSFVLVIPQTAYHNNPYYDYPFSDYTSGGHMRLPRTLNIGISVYYKYVMLDLRYKDTFDISLPDQGGITYLSNLLLQIGLAL